MKNLSVRTVEKARSGVKGTRQNAMSSDSSNQKVSTILLIAASRGLGLAMAAEFLKKGWNVVGTVRGGSGRTKLHDLADEFEGRLEIETLDICEQAQVTALRERLSGRIFEMLF